MGFTPGESIGAFRIIEQLGQGGMATVYKGYHAALDRYVAIKALHPAFKEDPTFLSRFEREARIVAKLDHPNIIPIYDFSQHEGTPYLVIRYIEGKTLKAILRQGQLSLDKVLSIICPVTEALAYAHAQGVLHRDIKPSNIMLTNDGHVYLTDFGLARLAQASDSTISKDMLIGTPQYISPEQAKGEGVDLRSDLYSLGVVLFEMLTGRVPFNADTPYAVIHDHIFTPLPLPTKINPNLSPEIERVLLKALAKDSEARYPNAAEMMASLERAIGPAAAPAPIPPPVRLAAVEEPVSPPSAPIQPPASIAIKPRRRWPTAILAGALALVVLLVCGVAVVGGREMIQRGLKGVFAFAQTDPVRIARDKVTANPKDPMAHLELANALAARKNFTVAFEEYDNAIDLNPQMAAPYLRAGALATELADFDRALKYYQSGWLVLNDNLDLLLAQGDVLGRMGKWDAARAVYEKVLRVDPNSAKALSGLGDCYREMDKPVEALREYGRALILNPNLPEAHYGLGALAMQRGANDEAKRQFNMVVNSPDASQELKDKANKQLRGLAK